ncbi:MAG: 50S ribosomal protein L21 [Spirochaetia bacterium]|nr:50S ribosomal protein L21 [Spirochaetia bacterium]
MFAIIKLAGHQHRVEKDQVLLTDLTGTEAGKELVCKDVLVVGAGTGIKIGKPFVAGATVKLKILEDLRGTKIRGFRYRKRKGTHRAWGHRQELQKVQVVEIKA